MTSCKMEVHYWDEFNGRMKLWDGVKSLGELVLEYTIVLGASRYYNQNVVRYSGSLQVVRVDRRYGKGLSIRVERESQRRRIFCGNT